MRSFSNFSPVKILGLVDTVRPKGSRAKMRHKQPPPRGVPRATVFYGLADGCNTPRRKH